MNKNNGEHCVSVGLLKPKSPTNVGAILRAANCFGVNSIYYTGDRYDRAEKFSTDTKNASHHIPLLKVEDLLSVVPVNVKIVCVEFAVGATLLPDFLHPDSAFYIFGPEDGSIDQPLLQKADAVVYVPTMGCMNLAASVNVVLYDRLAKSDLSFTGDHFVRQNRDTNNTAKVTASIKK